MSEPIDIILNDTTDTETVIRVEVRYSDCNLSDGIPLTMYNAHALYLELGKILGKKEPLSEKEIEDILNEDEINPLGKF